MYKKLVVILSILCVLVTITAAEGEISVGVKKGDWIEFEVATTGTPIEGHNLNWARMEILDIQGTEFTSNVTTETQNGTFSSIIRTFNFVEGNVQGWVVIPANLGPGDSFYDVFIDRNVTIEGEEQKTILGATRTITYANTPERQKEWDKSTGVFVTTLDTLENYTINATAIATNMWSPQIFGLDQTVFYVVVVVLVIAVIAVVAAVILIIARRKK